MPTVLNGPIESAKSTGERHLKWLRLAAKWKRLTIGSVATVCVLGLVLFLMLPDRYTATIVILPPAQNSASGASVMSQLGNMTAMTGGGNPLSIKNPNDQQVSFLKSATVETAMVNRFHLQGVYHTKYVSSACRKWERHSSADSGLKDGLIRLTVTDTDATRAAALVSGWVEEYRRLTTTLAVTEASQRRLFYETQLESAKANLTSAEEVMKDTQLRTGVLELDSQDKTRIASAAVLRAQLAAKQVEIRAMKQFASERNPDLERAQEEESGMEAQLAAMDVQGDRQSGDIVVPKGNYSQDALEYMRALREVKYRETILDLLTRQYEGARVDEAKQGSIIQVVDQAKVPDKPSSHYRLWTLLAALVLTVPISLGIVSFAEAGNVAWDVGKNSDSYIAAIEKIWFHFVPEDSGESGT